MTPERSPAFRSLPMVARALEPDLALPEAALVKGRGRVIGIHGVLYDVSDFDHPGGRAWMHATHGLDVTALFETSHVDHPAAVRALRRLPVLGTYDTCPHTRREFASYADVRARVRRLLPRRADRGMSAAGRHRMLLVWSLALGAHAVVLAQVQWTADVIDVVVLVGVSALLNSMIGGYGHNAMHRLEPAAVGLDWNGLSAYEWMLEHAISHHPHVNTPRDHDALSMEPFVRWLPDRPEAVLGDHDDGTPWIHLVYAVGELAVAVQGHLVHRTRWRPWWRGRDEADGVPWWMRWAPWLFVLRVASHWWVQGVLLGTTTLLVTMIVASYYFALLAHMSHDRIVPVDPSARPAHLDHQVANTRDLARDWLPWRLGDVALFLDRQVAHHLFPTVDHTRWTPARQRRALAPLRATA